MGVKDDAAGGNGNEKRNTRSSKRMASAKDDDTKGAPGAAAATDAAAPNAVADAAPTAAAAAVDAKPAKRKPAKKPRKAAKPAKVPAPALDQTISFFVPFLDGMLGNQPPPGPPGPPRKKRRKCAGIDNPAEDKYDRDHANYYDDLPADDKRRIAEMERKVSETRPGSGVPLRFRILQSGMSARTKGLVLQKAEGLMSGDPFNSEKAKLTKWMDIVLRIPFGVVKPPPVSRASSVAEISDYIRATEEALHRNVYGHGEAKGQIIQTLAKWISNPSSKGHVLGVHGPPGVGKSTLVKHIGDALGTPTVTIPLGGASDGAFLDGHSYVYEGSLPGAMVSSISKSGCMNPVILLDELDKVSASSKGAEIINVLIHLTDPVQNTAFRDKYLGDVELDLSQAVFVFTFNDINAVHPILKDRMLCIETKAYTFQEKHEITMRHLLPRICTDHGFAPGQFVIGEQGLRDVMARIESESGVRNMNRALEAIVSQVNFDRLLGKVEATDRIEIAGDMIARNIKRRPVNASVEHLYL